MTIRADGLGLHTAKKAVHHLNNSTTSTALRTRLELSTILGSRTVTMRALYVFLDLKVLLDASNHILQADLDTDADRIATLTAAFLIATKEAAETSARAAEERIEDVERIESSRSASSCSSEWIIKAILVIALTLLGITKHLIGLGTLLELLFGCLISRILIRVIFDSELAVSSLDFVVCRVLRDAQYLVVILLFHIHITKTGANIINKSIISKF